MQERIAAQNQRNQVGLEAMQDVARISVRPKSRTDSRPLRRSLKPHESGALNGYVMHNVSLEGQTSVVPKWKLEIARHASRRKQSMQRLGTRLQDFAPSPWEGVDYYEGRMAFGKPMLSTQQVEARRVDAPWHVGSQRRRVWHG